MSMWIEFEPVPVAVVADNGLAAGLFEPVVT
jgi:hypothetical protein